MMLDNEEPLIKTTGKRIKLIYSVLQIFGLIYGCWLFAYYWSLKGQYSNPLLPSYTTDFIFATEAYKGMFLLGGMALAPITFVFHRMTGLILLVLTYLLIPFALSLISLVV